MKNYVPITASYGAENRDPVDFYPTPEWATRALLDRESFEGDIWGPACGDGAISRALEGRGYHVYSSDLYDHGYGSSPVDFLKCPKQPTNNAITNPPFKHAEEFLHAALGAATKKVVLLNRLSWLEGSRRYKSVFNGATPLARVLVFSSRIHFHRSGNAALAGGGMVAFAWYVWDHAHTGPAELKWLPPQKEMK